jgi:hypothetical protein
MNNIAAQLTNAVNEFITTKSTLINWEATAAQGKWTNKEIIGHLIDSAHINLQRFVRCTYEDGFKLVYHQDEWVEAQQYKHADITGLLKLWELVNLQIARVLDNYPADRWQITCDNSREGTSLNTVEFLAKDYLIHLQHHLDQLA